MRRSFFSIPKQTFTKLSLSLTVCLLLFASIPPAVYATGSPCGPTVDQFDCSCPTGMSVQDCQSEIGPWVSYKPDDGTTTACGTSSTGTGVTLTGADNEAKVWNYLIAQLTPATPTPAQQALAAQQAAGIIGNLLWESGGALDPAALEAHGQGTDGYTGHGIVQWSWTRWRTDYGAVNSRSDANQQAVHADAAKQSDLTDFAPYPPKPPLDVTTLLGYAKSKNSTWQDLGTQISFMWSEIQPGGNRSTVLAAIKATTSVADSAGVWFSQYEQPGDSTLQSRIDDGNKALQTYGSAGAGGTPTVVGAPIQAPTPAAPAGCGSSAVNCPASGVTTVSNLSAIRTQVVCLAQKELTSVWTPLPAIPRMQYLTYSDGVPEEWCADFVSYLYNKAGYPFIGGSSGGWRLAAVDEVHALGTANGKFHWHDAAGYTPVPGDMAIHKGADVSHVNLVISVSGSTITLIGGDQGSGPYGGTDSASIVSQVNQAGSTGSTTIGYVSPD